MKVLGFHYSTTPEGRKNTTLHLADEFPDYFKKSENGRGCAGMRVETVYVGAYDCTSIKVGSEIEIFYDRAMQTKSGSFSPIKKIEMISK